MSDQDIVRESRAIKSRLSWCVHVLVWIWIVLVVVRCGAPVRVKVVPPQPPPSSPQPTSIHQERSLPLAQSGPASLGPSKYWSVSRLPVALGGYPLNCSVAAGSIRSVGSRPAQSASLMSVFGLLGLVDQGVAGFRADRAPHPLPGETAFAERRFRVLDFDAGDCNRARLIFRFFTMGQNSGTKPYSKNVVLPAETDCPQLDHVFERLQGFSVANVHSTDYPPA